MTAGTARRPGRHRATVALVVWTLLLWTTRIANIWRDADLDTGERWGRTLLALSFTVLAIAVVLALWRRLRQARVVAVGALAGWTIAVWVVRGIGILAADHDLGFKAVHTALAVVSIVLAVLAWRETRRQTSRPPIAAQVPAGRRD
jgi:peptidoglycan/LPS O-acetylase OafA/YrhL